MPKFLPIFPLALVAYPGEHLNLHIFEPRYKELIGECLKEEKTFGIPSVVGEQIKDYGTEMELLSIDKVYPDGKMDVRTRGLRVFKVLELVKKIPEKKYSAAIVSEPDNIMDADVKVSSALFGYLKQVQDLLNVHKPKYEKPSEIVSFDIAHRIGMSVEKEYELLMYTSEIERQRYIIGHLRNIIPVLLETERTKSLAKLNGHFRSEIPPKF